ncbi:MAG: D-alanine-D-alanine ligase [bacterium]|jgi:D-alanine-D-alanine ligase
MNSINVSKNYYDFEKLAGVMEGLKSTLRIAVVYAGKSNQGASIFETFNPRSWKSYEVAATDIYNALKELGFKHVYLFADGMTLQEELKKEKIHFVWLNTGGVQGYNPISHTPALLESLGIPYVGHNPLNASLLDSKDTFKRQLVGLGLKTAPFITHNEMMKGKYNPKNNPNFKKQFGDYQGPFVVKPFSGRASQHVHFVDKIQELPWRISQVAGKIKSTVVVEKYLEGREFCISVCGRVRFVDGKLQNDDKPFVFSPIERVLEKDEQIFTSMDQKAITSRRVQLLSKDEIKLRKQLEELANQVFDEFSLQTLVRLDVRADENGELNILEVNPKPDLKKPDNQVINLVTVSLEDEHNMSYNDLIYSLLADRLHFLLSHYGDVIQHIRDLIENRTEPESLLTVKSKEIVWN